MCPQTALADDAGVAESAASASVEGAVDGKAAATLSAEDASATAYSRSVKAVKAYASKNCAYATYEESGNGCTIVKVDISDLGLTASQRQKVQDRLLYNTDYWYLQLSDGDSTKSTLVYRFMYADGSIPMRQKKLDAAVAKAKVWIANCKDDFQVAHMLNDWMVKNVAYDYDDANHSIDRKQAYRCLAEGKADCNGFAYGMDYLLRKCGYLTAFALNVKADHIWNMVKIGSRWYHVDVTWDKTCSYRMYWKNCICHRWLLLSDAAMNGDEHKGWVTIRNGVETTVKATGSEFDVYYPEDWNPLCRKAVAVGTSFKVGGITYKVASKGKSVRVAGVTSKSKTSYTVPSEVWYRGYSYKVTKVSAGSFKNCTKAKAVTIGANVNAIGSQAFAGCSKLKTITVKSSKLTKSGVKNSLKGSKVTKVKLSGTAVKVKKSAYKKIFTKANAGRKASVS